MVAAIVQLIFASNLLAARQVVAIARDEEFRQDPTFMDLILIFCIAFVCNFLWFHNVGMGVPTDLF